VFSVTPRPRFTPGERTPGTHWIGGLVVGPRAGLDAGARRKILCPCPLSGIEPRSPDRPARSQTLYCLSYRGSALRDWETANTIKIFWFDWRMLSPNPGTEPVTVSRRFKFNLRSRWQNFLTRTKIIASKRMDTGVEASILRYNGKCEYKQVGRVKGQPWLVCGQNAELLNVKIGGTHSYHCYPTGQEIACLHKTTRFTTVLKKRRYGQARCLTP
jgi:hypothetical protein